MQISFLPFLRTITAIVAGAAITLGCATPPAPTDGEAAASQVPENAGTLHMYRVREGGSNLMGNNVVYLDGKRIGRLNTGESFEYKAAPGLHQLSVVPEAIIPGFKGKETTFQLDVQPNGQHFIRYGTRQSVAVLGTTVTGTNQAVISIVSEDDWRERR